MKIDEIEVGGSYAYVQWDRLTNEPLRAEVLAQVFPVEKYPFVRVMVHHPDAHVPNQSQEVRVGELRGRWGDQSMIAGLTWEGLAEQRYRHVCQQRVLARRLARVGIYRTELAYAGQGGTSTDYGHHSASLILGYEELEKLLDLIDDSAVHSAPGRIFSKKNPATVTFDAWIKDIPSERRGRMFPEDSPEPEDVNSVWAPNHIEFRREMVTEQWVATSHPAEKGLPKSEGNERSYSWSAINSTFQDGMPLLEIKEGA